VEDAGKQVVRDSADVDCVVVGLDRSFDYDKLSIATTAIRSGATFVATNDDLTFPTAEGLLPGAGSVVAAVQAASGVAPIVAGKPNQPIIDLVRSTGVGEAYVIGDRIDTDILLARSEPDWTSILVMTGVTGPDDDTSMADFVVADISAAADLVVSRRNER
ncbi:MAG: HAD hydrolase-like protein, partial [Acidimicrobiia bacterium]|nr:HAD hydrolase-like protein [Acidimicrobiia bacterium]